MREINKRIIIINRIKLTLLLLIGVLAMDALHRQVLPFLLRRMKEDVLQDLPPKIIQDYYCTLSTLQVRNLVIAIVVVGAMFIRGMF